MGSYTGSVPARRIIWFWMGFDVEWRFLEGGEREERGKDELC